jgi:hypothetical protein
MKIRVEGESKTIEVEISVEELNELITPECECEKGNLNPKTTPSIDFDDLLREWRENQRHEFERNIWNGRKVF